MAGVAQATARFPFSFRRGALQRSATLGPTNRRTETFLMSKNIKINIHSSGSVKSEEIRTQGDHAEVVEAMRGARYELIDNDTGSVPEGLSLIHI